MIDTTCSSSPSSLSSSTSASSIIFLTLKKKICNKNLFYASPCRLEWESAILRGCSSFRRMEEDRLSQLRFLAEQYQQILEEHRPKLVASANRLDEPIRRIHVGRDMEVVRKKVILLIFARWCLFDDMLWQVLMHFFNKKPTPTFFASGRGGVLRNNWPNSQKFWSKLSVIVA